jgi:hypothetical protein
VPTSKIAPPTLLVRNEFERFDQVRTIIGRH